MTKIIKNFRNKFKIVCLTMFKQYMLFSIIMCILVCFSIGFIFYCIVNMTDSEEYTRETQGYYLASKIVKKDYKNIDASKAIKVGGWVEILNSDKKLIYVIGNKKDSKKIYNEDEMINLLNESYNKVNHKQEYYCSIAIFNLQNKKYYCIVKVPSKIMNVNIDINPENMSSKTIVIEKYVNKIALKILQLILCIFLVIFILGITYAFFTSRKIVKPLKKILFGIKNMTSGDYSTRIKFKADNEFAEIRDAFNFMASKIQTSEIERKQIEKYKNQFLLDISHDLKTPVTSIQGYSKALYDEVVDDEGKKKRYYKIIYDKSKRVTKLIDNVHELTKIDNEGYVFNKKNQDICEFLREILADFYKEIEDKSFDLEVEIPEYEIIYDFDKLEMNRAIANIISNGIKYNENNTKMKIQLKEDKNKIYILIGDNGIGIHEELKKQIFEPFTRGDLSRCTTGGTGLGLSISKKIIEKHKGKLVLTSNLKYKTIFKIVLNINKVIY
ncbi:ATP-binding protein [Haloimpatiens sp. FM7315]|uniref:sensor histidine kinase n=1 Tax=Haloimpatiens sp. FM7315 TaxID=3298609 RepID=UPI00370B3576